MTKRLDAWTPARLAVTVSAAIAVALLVIPRCLINYGENGDALNNAADAVVLARYGFRNGVPLMVRWPPGVPAFDYALVLVAPWGKHVASNLLVFAFFVASIFAFWRMTATLPNRGWLVGTFALTPIILRDSAVCQDFVPGMALVMAAYLALDRRSYLAGGLLIGVATGFRVTNILVIFPAGLFIMVADASRPLWHRFRNVALMLAAAVSCGFAWYLPFVYYSGLGWRYFVPLRHGEVYLKGFVYNTLYVFGPVTLSVIAAVAACQWRPLVSWARAQVKDPSPRVIFALGVVLVHMVINFRFPNKVSYYIPAVPFFYILLAEWISRRGLQIVAFAVMSFALVSVELKGGESGNRTLRPHLAWGCVMEDWIRRSEIEELRSGIAELRSLGKAVVLTGMGGVLTRDNSALTKVDTATISPGLDPATGRYHRAVSEIMYRVKASDVFLMGDLSLANVRLLRAEGYKIFMFSEYAPSGLRSEHGYDPYQEGIESLPVFTQCAFYRPACKALP